MKKLFTALLILAMLNKSEAQIITSFAVGYEYKNSAIPVQLAVGISSRSIRGELMTGYTVFFHRNDAVIPKILFLRYGLSLTKGRIEIMPLIGAGMALPVTYEKVTSTDEQHLYDNYEIVRNPSKYKILYGLKVQKSMGLGGLFVSAEHCNVSYLNAGLFVRVN